MKPVLKPIGTPDWQRFVGLATGLSVFAVISLIPPPATVSSAGWAVLAVATLMAIWWMSEAAPLAATALVPIVAFPLLGIGPIGAVAASYAHPLVFLFLGGFLLARAMQRWGLHHRIAWAVLSVAPRSASGIIGAVMATTAFLSMWISNTAAALVMVPIAQAVARALGPGRTAPSKQSSDAETHFPAAMMLGVAFSATIGGMATIIGTPPNALVAGYMQTAHNVQIGFVQWMGLGVPIVALLLPATWILLTRFAFEMPRLSKTVLDIAVEAAPARTAPLSWGACLTAIIVTIAALLLVARPLLQSSFPSLAISDPGILIGAAIVLFVVPAPGEDSARLLEWDDAKSISWDVLILFGGGLALADAIESSGLSSAIGSTFSALDTLPVTLVVLSAMIGIVYLGELASNTAMAAVFLPIAGAASIGLSTSPLELVLPIGLAASLGFMLPVATPPNAIAFGTGLVSSRQMLKTGAALDVIGIAIVFAIVTLLGPFVFGR